MRRVAPHIGRVRRGSSVPPSLITSGSDGGGENNKDYIAIGEIRDESREDEDGGWSRGMKDESEGEYGRRPEIELLRA